MHGFYFLLKDILIKFLRYKINGQPETAILG